MLSWASVGLYFLVKLTGLYGPAPPPITPTIYHRVEGGVLIPLAEHNAVIPWSVKL